MSSSTSIYSKEAYEKAIKSILDLMKSEIQGDQAYKKQQKYYKKHGKLPDDEDELYPTLLELRGTYNTAALKEIVEKLIRKRDHELDEARKKYYDFQRHATHVLIPQLNYLRDLIMSAQVARMMPRDSALERTLDGKIDKAADKLNIDLGLHNLAIWQNLEKKNLLRKEPDALRVQATLENFDMPPNAAKNVDIPLDSLAAAVLGMAGGAARRRKKTKKSSKSRKRRGSKKKSKSRRRRRRRSQSVNI